MAKYHLVTYHPTENGYDDKEDLGTMKEVNSCAENYLKEMYEEVLVFSNQSLVKVFDKRHKRGRKPFPFEMKKFQSA